MQTAVRRGAAASVRVRLLALLLLIAAFAIPSGAALLVRQPLALPRLVRSAQLRLAGATFLPADDVVYQRSFNDCGPAALANVLRLLKGSDVPGADSLAQLAGLKRSGTTLGGLASAAEQLGVRAQPIRLDPDARLSPPFIAWSGSAHFVVVERITARGMVVVIDPQVGRYEITFARFRKDWRGEALMLI